MQYYSPLRYPGGKGKISSFFLELFKKNNLKGGVYIEPYVGGGSIALFLLINKYVNKIIINDKDRSIYAFWYSTLFFTEELCDKIENTPVTIETWCKQREIQQNKKTENLLDLGFSTFFLNRTNRSGIIKGGVIGGINQQGNYLIDARYNKKDLINRIQTIAAFSPKIELYNLDAIDLIKTINIDCPQKTLFYFDPPYCKKGKGLYMNFLNEDDHYNIFNAISKLEDIKWIVTYDVHPLIRKLYKNYRIFRYGLNYSAATKAEGTEYIIFSKKFRIPRNTSIPLKRIHKGES